MAYYAQSGSAFGSPPKTGGMFIPPGQFGFKAPSPSYLGGTKAAAAPTAPTGGQPQPSSPSGNPYDYSNDPILARIRALGEEQVAQAGADAQSARIRLAIGYGDPALAQSLGLSSDVQKQAAGNPFGTQQELQRGYKRRNVFDINSPLSDQHNLFYSSERARELALSGEQLLRDKATSYSAVQGQLQKIEQDSVQAKMDQQMQLIQAEQDAYGRALSKIQYATGVS